VVYDTEGTERLATGGTVTLGSAGAVLLLSA